MQPATLEMLVYALAFSFAAVMSALMAVIAWIGQRGAGQLERLTDSVNELNVKVARVIESVKLTENQLLDHKERIEKLETRGVGNGTKKARS